jgi:hypothetical protein
VSEEKATDVGPSGIEVAYERIGDPLAPPVLLIMGGGAQLGQRTERAYPERPGPSGSSPRSPDWPDGLVS